MSNLGHCTLMTASYNILSLLVFISVPFSVLTAQPPFVLKGGATAIGDHCYRLSSETEGASVGAIWSEMQIDLRHSFDIRFAINLGCSSQIGEGMAFVLQTYEQGLDALGCSGPSLGFGKVPNQSCSPEGNSLALELDSKYNRGYRDLLFPHLCFVRDGKMDKPLQQPTKFYSYARSPLDCEYHALRITWKPSRQELQVFVEDELRLSCSIDLIGEVFQGETEVNFGFTASSAARPNPHMLCVQSVTLEVDEDMQRRIRFEEGVGIYNNPQRERLTIDVRLDTEQYIELQLFDSDGELIYEIPPHLVRDNQYYVNLPGLPSGVYFITVTNGTQRVSRKVVHTATIRA